MLTKGTKVKIIRHKGVHPTFNDCVGRVGVITGVYTGEVYSEGSYKVRFSRKQGDWAFVWHKQVRKHITAQAEKE